jgi:hypothetical protein
MPTSGARHAGAKRAFTLHALPRYGRVAPLKREALADLARSLSRRSSVVEHVIGNDGVSSSILLGGTKKSLPFAFVLTPC